MIKIKKGDRIKRMTGKTDHDYSALKNSTVKMLGDTHHYKNDTY
jgi:hypothetical protein